MFFRVVIAIIDVFFFFVRIMDAQSAWRILRTLIISGTHPATNSVSNASTNGYNSDVQNAHYANLGLRC